jgi:small subunit ribosomal protein S6
MPAEKPLYDLVMLLDLSATDDVRAKLVADTRAAIERDGELVAHHPWGQRSLAYEIKRREAAEYHLFQIHATAQLLESLDRQLRIADGVLRHRLIKLAPGTPPPRQRPDSPRSSSEISGERAAESEPAATREPAGAA